MVGIPTRRTNQEQEMLPMGEYALEILAVDYTETYGPQLMIEFRVHEGARKDETFRDYFALSDEGEIKVNDDTAYYTKLVTVLAATVGVEALTPEAKSGFETDDLVGHTLRAYVTTTQSGSRNKIQHGTVSTTGAKRLKSPDPNAPNYHEDFSDIPF